jgi:Stage III sporulation protein AB (spore_III_AB).
LRAFLGAALFTLAWTLVGCGAAARLRARARTLWELCRMMELLRFELARFAPPMPELFAQLGKTAPGAGGEISRRLYDSLNRLGDEEFSDLWERALGDLSGPERETMAALGRGLGRYGAQEELAALDVCRERLMDLSGEAERTAKERGRLYVGLSAAVGAVASVLML